MFQWLLRKNTDLLYRNNATGLGRTFWGMKIAMLTRLLLITMCMIGAASSQAKEPQMDLAPAYSWLELLDNGRYYQTWQYASHTFKQRIAASKWDQVLKGTRSKLGELQNRTLAGYSKRQQFSGMPDGEYLVLKFTSQYEHADTLSELLVLTEEQGELRVIAYFIQ